MPENPRDVILGLAEAAEAWRERQDVRLRHELEAAYGAARLEVLGRIDDRRRKLAQASAFSTETETEQAARIARALARDEALFRQIEGRLAELRGEVLGVVEAAQTQGVSNGAETASEELSQVQAGLGLAGSGIGFRFDLVNFETVEVGLQAALEALLQEQAAVGQALTTGLRLGLLQGESFEQLLKRLLDESGSVWARGPISALLGARRTVITAENAARDALYQAYGLAIPGLGKQALAAISPETTECCLRVHGQIQPLDKPYRLEGEPRFADEMMYPGFHWNCRTSSVAYHPDFEVGSALPTRVMVARARAELAQRK